MFSGTELDIVVGICDEPLAALGIGGHFIYDRQACTLNFLEVSAVDGRLGRGMRTMRQASWQRALDGHRGRRSTTVSRRDELAPELRELLAGHRRGLPAAPPRAAPQGHRVQSAEGSREGARASASGAAAQPSSRHNLAEIARPAARSAWSMPGAARTATRRSLCCAPWRPAISLAMMPPRPRPQPRPAASSWRRGASTRRRGCSAWWRAGRRSRSTSGKLFRVRINLCQALNRLEQHHEALELTRGAGLGPGDAELERSAAALS